LDRRTSTEFRRYLRTIPHPGNGMARDIGTYSQEHSQ